jgi:hypothetical protein
MGNRRSNPDTLRNLINFVTLSRQGADEPGMCQVDLFQTDTCKGHGLHDVRGLLCGQDHEPALQVLTKIPVSFFQSPPGMLKYRKIPLPSVIVRIRMDSVTGRFIVPGRIE